MSAKISLREITNQVNNPNPQQETKNASWNGVHIRFDDEGNREVVIKDVTEPIQNVPETKIEGEQVNSEEEVSEVCNEEEGEELENKDIWDYREPNKQKEWCGSHIFFEDSTEESLEEDKDVQEDDTDTALTEGISKLLQ